MRKNEKGILTIEASIVLCVLTLLMLFLFNFATVYRAQNMVSHATLQTADAVALESYLRETSFETDEQSVLFWANRINGVTSISEDSFESLRTADLETVIKEKFALAVSDSEAQADSVLRSLSVKDGLNGIDFSQSYVDFNRNDVIVKAEYTVKLRFPVFGAKELQISKSAKAKTVGEILFALNVIPEQQIMGTASGSGKFNIGTQVQISAEENYGYDFVSWNDGNTENPRMVTVTKAQTYVAQFKRQNFGVNLFIRDASSLDGRVRGSNAFGTVTALSNGALAVGGGEYSYETTVSVKAEEKPGYKFLYWRGSKVSDTGTENIYRTEKQFDVYIDGTYDLTAFYQPITYTIDVSTDCDAAENSIGVRKKGSSSYGSTLAVEYGNKIQLKASELAGYTFLGWYKDGTKVSSSGEAEFPVPVGGGTYVAKYEKDPIIRLVANGRGTVKILTTGKTSSSCKRGSSVEIFAKPNAGYYFAGWSDGKSVRHWVTVNSDITLTATFKKYYSVTVIAGAGGSVSGGGTTFKENDITTIKATPNTGYHFVKWQKSTIGGIFYRDVSGSAENQVTVTTNVYYRAVFAKNTYTVTLNANDGGITSGTASSYQVSYGDNSRALPRPFREGYRFAGWTYNGNTYNEGAVVSNIKGNITLTAKWTRCSYHKWGHCGVKHSLGGSYWWPATDVHTGLGGHYVSWASCTRCVYCTKRGSFRVLCGTHWEMRKANGWYGYDYVGPNACGAYNLP